MRRSVYQAALPLLGSVVVAGSAILSPRPSSAAVNFYTVNNFNTVGWNVIAGGYGGSGAGVLVDPDALGVTESFSGGNPGASNGGALQATLATPISTLGYKNISMTFDWDTVDDLEFDTFSFAASGDGYRLSSSQASPSVVTSAGQGNPPSGAFGSRTMTFSSSVNNSSISNLVIQMQANAVDETIILRNFRLFGDGNDSKIWLGTPEPTSSNQTTSTSFGFGRAIVGASVSTDITLNKNGVDATTYSRTATGDLSAPTSASGLALAGGTQSVVVPVSIATGTPGMKSGTIVFDNLATTSNGNSQGSNNGDATATITGEIVAHANGSLSPTDDLNTRIIDLGDFAAGSGNQAFSLMGILTNFAGIDPQAALDLDSILVLSGATGVISLTPTTLGNLLAGSSGDLGGMISTTTPGAFSATYTLNLSDEDLPGATAEALTLTLAADVITAVVPEPACIGAMLTAAAVMLRRRK